MSTLKELAQQILTEKNSKIISGNIKNSTQIFDVTGNFTSDADATASDILKDKTAYVNGEKITGTYEASGGSGDIKLFTSVQAMQADPDPSEGDMAMVYNTTYQNWQRSTVGNRVHFPDTVTLPSPITQEYFYGNIDSYAVDSSNYDSSASVSLNGMKEENIFNIDIMIYGSGMSESSIKYTSEDNQHFTKTQGDSDIELPIDVSHNKEMRRRF